MASDTVPSPPSDSPLYIRWGPDRSPYAIELKLDLVERLRRALLDARSSGQEIGGILVGALPTAQMPTLRIEEIEFLARRVEDGPTFLLESGGGERFGEARGRARGRERSLVGHFRSHLRPGPLRPTLADRTLLAAEFKDPVYLLLLANASEPFTSAFFVASNGPLPAEVSVREFNLDPAEFRGLPEVEPETTVQPVEYAASVSSGSRLGTIAALLLLFLGIAGALYYFNKSVFLAFWNGESKLALSVQPQDGLLRISWNQDAKDLARSTGATLHLQGQEGRSERVIHLGQDELRLGAVVLESKSARVDVRLTLTHSAGDFASDQVIWTR